jgi:DNA-directed RNA polymerase specialized sigma subunit
MDKFDSAEYSIEDVSSYLEKHRKRYNYIAPFLTDTIFKNNWFANEKYKLAEPFKTNEEEAAAWKCFKNTRSNIAKRSLFDHLMILAFYMSYFHFLKWKTLCDDIEEYLSYNLKRLWWSIEMYDDSFGASFNTFFMHDTNFRIERYITNRYSRDALTYSTRMKLTNLTNRIISAGYDFEDIKLMNDAEFISKFGAKRSFYIKALMATQISSLNEPNLNYDSKTTKLDYIDDPSQNQENWVMSKITLDEIIDIAARKFKNQKRRFNIWKEYCVIGNQSFKDIGDKYGITGERVRQICYKVNRQLRDSYMINEIKRSIEET